MADDPGFRSKVVAAITFIIGRFIYKRLSRKKVEPINE